MRTALALLLSCTAALAQLGFGDPGFVADLTQPAAAVGGISCSDANVLFVWHAESTDVTSGTPAGCSDGDTAASANGSVELTDTVKYDGTYSELANASNEYYYFEVSGRDILDERTGTLEFRVRFSSWASGVNLLYIVSSDSADALYVKTVGTDDATGRELTFGVKGNNNSQTTSTTTADMALDTWYLVTMKWTNEDVDPNIYGDVDGTATATDNDNPQTWIGSPTTMRVGAYGTFSGGVYIDSLIVYNSWQ